MPSRSRGSRVLRSAARRRQPDPKSVLQQPRRFALLAYLALATRHGPVQRDTVHWACSGPTRRRTRRAVRSTRPSTTCADPSEPMRSARSATRSSSSRDQVTCDAVDFAEAHAAGRWKAAHDLYAGDLLPRVLRQRRPRPISSNGSTVSGARSIGSSRDAVCHLAADAEQAHATADAIVWTRRACAASGTEEAEIRKLMESMDRLGDRSGVVEAYDKLSGDLAALEMEPSPETTDLLGTLKQRVGRRLHQRRGSLREIPRGRQAPTPRMPAVTHRFRPPPLPPAPPPAARP